MLILTDEQQAAARNACLCCRMHAHEKIRQAQHAHGGDKTKRCPCNEKNA